MDFATLKADILSLIGRAPADVCYRLTTADINAVLRVSAMEGTATLTEAAEITLPTDFLGVIDVYRDADPRVALSPTTLQALNSVYMTSGMPREYAISNGKMLLNPSPDGTTDIKMRYYAKLADMLADDDTNGVLTDYPGIYVYGVLRHHSALIRDAEALAAWQPQFVSAMKAAQVDDNNKRYMGVSLTPKARATA